MSPKRSSQSVSDQPLRIGTVPYCNAWPLTRFLPRELPGILLSDWIPSDMRLRLMAHHLDLVLMPVAELMNLPYGKIISNCCIGCRGPGRSVLLVSKKPIHKIKTMSLDRASRSSITICELILRHFYDLKPDRYSLALDKPLNDCKTDAMVVIGDRALAFHPADSWEYRFDLGELWQEKTGLPLIFAAWIACSEPVWSRPGIVQSLQSARDHGLADIDSLLVEKEQNGVAMPLSREKIRSYLTEAINYRIDDDEKRSLQAFFDLSLLHGLTKMRTIVEIIEER